MLRSPVLETAVRELMDKAQGLFLYASLLARQLDKNTTPTTAQQDNKKLDFKDLRGLPTGMSEVYEVNFERMVQSSRQGWDEHYSRLIALIVAAREPVPVAVAREVSVVIACVVCCVLCVVCCVLCVVCCLLFVVCCCCFSVA